MLRRNYRTFASLVIAAIVLACAPIFAPASAPVPTFDPNSINTSIVQTADAAFTQTAFFITPTDAATITSTATILPTETLTATPTFFFVLSTPTVPTETPEPGSSGLKYDCRIVSKTPADGAIYAPNVGFVTRWQVINMGTGTWDSDNADYRYDSGDKLHISGVYDLEKSVPPGGQADIKVDMKAPGNGGTFSTTWVIKIGKAEFCQMTVTIQVNN